MKRTMIAITLAATMGAGAVTTAGSAQAASTTQPSASTKAAIAQAIKRSPLVGDVAPDLLLVTKTRLAKTDHSWAAAQIAIRNSDSGEAQVLLKRINGRWQVRDLGTDQIGCQIAPKPIRNQLSLWDNCVPA